MAQTAPPKVLAVPSSSRFGKDTKIGHFLKFFKGGTKGKSQKKEADFGGDQGKIAKKGGRLRGLENHLGANGASAIIGENCASKSARIKIGHFLKFFKGGTKGKWAQTALPSN